VVRDCNMLKQDLYNKLFLTREAIKRAGSKANDSLVSLIVVDCSTSVCKVRTKLQQIVAWVFERILGGSGAWKADTWHPRATPAAAFARHAKSLNQCSWSDQARLR
jgi:hypothetical protein